MKIAYGLNEKDALVFVNHAWDLFALENNGAHLQEQHVLGKSLWSFISDGMARKLYRGALQQVRRGFLVDLTLRCDAPWERRLVQLLITPGVRADVEFRTHLLTRKARPVQQLLDPRIPRSAESVFVCCWCNRVATDIASWWEIEEAAEHLKIPKEAPLPCVEHITCPECYHKITEVLEGSTGVVKFPTHCSEAI